MEILEKGLTKDLFIKQAFSSNDVVPNDCVLILNLHSSFEKALGSGWPTMLIKLTDGYEKLGAG